MIWRSPFISLNMLAQAVEDRKRELWVAPLKGGDLARYESLLPWQAASRPPQDFAIQSVYKAVPSYNSNMAYMRLTIEPIPATSRSASLAKLLPRSQWNRIRRSIYYKAQYRCHVCGRGGRLHCHEVWQYNGRTGYQHLRGFQALCQDCHQDKHIFFVRDHRLMASALRHLAAVNKLTLTEAQQQLAAARRRQIALNQLPWIVNYGPYNWQVPPQQRTMTSGRPMQNSTDNDVPHR